MTRVTNINPKPRSFPGLCSFWRSIPSQSAFLKWSLRKVQSRTAHKKLRTDPSKGAAPKSKCRDDWA